MSGLFSKKMKELRKKDKGIDKIMTYYDEEALKYTSIGKWDAGIHEACLEKALTRVQHELGIEKLDVIDGKIYVMKKEK